MVARVSAIRQALSERHQNGLPYLDGVVGMVVGLQLGGGSAHQWVELSLNE
ncbi:MAG: hypothetical protein N2443_04570 [Blastocatellia bacterium]|nr:hypothetical protein [Blastocatellia bacterium]